MKKGGLILRTKHVLEAAIAWGFYFLLKLLPLDFSSTAMGNFLRFVGPYIPVSQVARTNLDLAFPNKTPKEKREIVRGCWDNLGRVVGEFPHLQKITKDPARVTVKGMEHVHEIKKSGKSAIIFSGHLANWEVFGAMAHRESLPVSLVYRPANNPLTEALYRYARKDIAQNLYPKNREGAKQILKAIRNNEVLGMLVDQKMNDGMEVPFFGHPAMTAKAIAEFALRQNVPIYPARIERHNGAHFTLEMFPALQCPTGDDHAKNVLELLTTINRLLETWITAKPKQWFWLHRRWPKNLY